MPSARRPFVEPLEGRLQFAASFPQTFGGSRFDEVTKIAQGPDGSLVVVGLFSGTTNFARPGNFAEKGFPAFNLTARGDTDVFVATYRADGSLKWATQVGGDYTNSDLERFTRRDLAINQQRLSRFVGKVGAEPRNAGEYANDVAVDAAGNVYLAGAFRDTIRAGRTKLTADQQYTSNYYDALVVKFSGSGKVQWARKFGGGFDDDALSIALDKSGTPTVGGYFSRTADFSTGGPARLLQTDGRDGGFVLRLTPAGQYAWAYAFQSDSINTDERNAVNDVAVTGNGEVYFAGTYAGEAQFDGRRGPQLDSEGKTDAVLGKLSRRGQFIFAQSSGGEEYDGNSAVTLDAAGNVYTAGYFGGEDTDVDPRPGVETLYTATPRGSANRPEFTDLLISRFDANGTPAWIKQIGGGYIELASDITVGGNGDVYVGGSFFNTVDFAPGALRRTLASTPTNAGSIKDKNTNFGRNESYDWFVLRLRAATGQYFSAVQQGSADDDYAAGLLALADGNVLAYGRTVAATGTDRDGRQEQSAVYAYGPDLSIRSFT